VERNQKHKRRTDITYDVKVREYVHRKMSGLPKTTTNQNIILTPDSLLTAMHVTVHQLHECITNRCLFISWHPPLIGRSLLHHRTRQLISPGGPSTAHCKVADAPIRAELSLIERLPTEIPYVVRCIPNIDLTRLVCVARQFHSITEHNHYEDVVLRRSTRTFFPSLPFLDAVQARPHLAQKVLGVSLSFSDKMIPFSMKRPKIPSPHYTKIPRTRCEPQVAETVISFFLFECIHLIYHRQANPETDVRLPT